MDEVMEFPETLENERRASIFDNDDGNDDSSHDDPVDQGYQVNHPAQGSLVSVPENEEDDKLPPDNIHPELETTCTHSVTRKLRPSPSVVDAQSYDIVPTMAAPQATSINAIAITPDMRYWMTGGSDGYVRKYDGLATINGKQFLTVAQRHSFVDSVMKAAVLLSYWENFEPANPTVNGKCEDSLLSPVYSLAIHSEAVWCLSGLESGGINIQTVRHYEGTRIHCLQKHSNTVSALSLAVDEQSCLSGSWDKAVLDWDLNTGDVKRSFDGSGGQISAIEPRPLAGAPITVVDDEEDRDANTERHPLKLFSNAGEPLQAGDFSDSCLTDTSKGIAGNVARSTTAGQIDPCSPAHESLFGGGSDGGSLFGDDDSAGLTFGAIDGGPFDHTLDNETLPSGHFPKDPPMFETMSTALQPPDEDVVDAPLITGFPSFTGLSPFNGAGDHDLHQTASNSGLPNDLVPETSQQEKSITTPETEPQPSLSKDMPFENQNTFKHSPDDKLAMETRHPLTISGVSGDNSIHKSTSFVDSPPRALDSSQASATTFMSASINGTIRIWDRRVASPVARISTRPGTPPWCMGICWSPDGNAIYAGRRNGTVEEFSIHKAQAVWEPVRTLKFPFGSGPVSAVRPMANGRHLVCASNDILRLWDLKDQGTSKNSIVPFLVIPGHPRPGVISSLWIDPTNRVMISAAGTRGWDGSCTEVLVGYEIEPVSKM